MGCHGGAGTTTLATLVPGARDLGAFDTKRHGTQGLEEDLVLVARDSVSASVRAAEVVNILGFLGLRITALVVVAETPGRIPADARSRLRLLEGQTSAPVFFPYVSQFRYVNTPDVASAKLPRKAQQAIDQIIAAGERAGRRNPS
ncbi:hypothetical protein [Nocardiopsis synnemataformans]|uniref:hypothetical protein n=1 Tax=Nocardiopsis synnemataformans TaxID=61305 RepID=UPI003EBFA3E7